MSTQNRAWQRRFLASASFTTFSLGSVLGWAADRSWTNNNGSGDNRWTVDNNWSTSLQTTGSDRALIVAGNPGSQGRIFIRSSGSSTASVGTIQINTPSGTYGGLRSDTSISNVASLIFGTGSSSFNSGIDLDMSSGTDFAIGDEPDSAGGGTITITNSGRMDINVRDGQTLEMQAKMIGGGSLVLARLGSLVSDSTIRFGNDGEGGAVELSTFTGGVTVNSGILSLEVSSLPSSGAITSGPIGTGTLTLAGGRLNVEETGSGDLLLGNYVTLSSDATVTGGSSLKLNNTLNLGSSRILTRGDSNGLIFANTTFAGAGDIRPGDGFATFDIGSSTSRTLSGNVGVGTSTVTGTVNKEGSGTFTANHFRVSELNVNAGTLVVAVPSGSTFSGNTSGTSRVNTLAIAGGSIATATLDLTNNDVIIDYSGTSPLNSGTASDLVKQLASGRNSGSWNGNGIISATARANSATLGIGYGEASTVYGIGGSSTATFSGQTVDATTVIIKFTVLGDADLDGENDIDDFEQINPNFNTAQLWTGGDFNYDGVYDIDDFGLFNQNFNAYTGSGEELRPGVVRAGQDRLGTAIGEALAMLGDHAMMLDDDIDLTRLPLFIAMHDNAHLYWEAHDRPDIWRYFEAYVGMDLGVTTPDRPMGGRLVPEPAGFMLALTPLASRRRKSAIPL